MNKELFAIEHFKVGDRVMAWYSKIEYEVIEVIPAAGKQKGNTIIKNEYGEANATHGQGRIFSYAE